MVSASWLYAEVRPQTPAREAAADDAKGNFAADLLLTPDATLTLKSPCLNVGLPLAWTVADVDLAGNPRVKGKGVDLGCFEYIPKGFAVLVR